MEAAQARSSALQAGQGVGQFALGDLQGALDDYRAIIDLYPDMMQAQNNSGHILQTLGRDRDAAEMYERAALHSPCVRQKTAASSGPTRRLLLAGLRLVVE